MYKMSIVICSNLIFIKLINACVSSTAFLLETTHLWFLGILLVWVLNMFTVLTPITHQKLTCVSGHD